MKKLAAVLILAAAITMTGCQGSKQEEKPAASKTEEVNQASDELKEKLGDGYILPSEAVTKVLAKKWDVVGTESVYAVLRQICQEHRGARKTELLQQYTLERLQLRGLS